jgi:hypothetical protein
VTGVQTCALPIYDYISKLTDTEIFTNIGIYVPYDSRTELVNNTVATFSRLQFMYPTIRMESRSYNKETPIIGTDITDARSFMICFGTAPKYYVYEPEELTGAFYRDDETGIMEFRRPENINAKFTLNDIEGLRRLMTFFPPSPENNALIATIDDGLIDAKEKIAYDDVARTRLLPFDENTRQLIRMFLKQLFYTGMYMRRWVGPGAPFPLKTETTKTTKEPDAKVTEQLGIGIEYLTQMGKAAKHYCLNLKICEYNKNGGIDHGNLSLEREWENVIKGTQCIRMASSKFVGTGYHYLRAIFRETIPGMDIRAVDRIV